jgi:hypothetical protein
MMIVVGYRIERRLTLPVTCRSNAQPARKRHSTTMLAYAKAAIHHLRYHVENRCQIVIHLHDVMPLSA